MDRFAGLEPAAGDRVELLVADASLARALHQGIPAARLLARARLASDERDGGAAWDSRMRRLLRDGSPAYERVKKAIARHGRVAADEGALDANDATVAVLVWAVACGADPDASIAELAPASGAARDEHVVRACAQYDPRLALPGADERAPGLEACVRLATRATLGPMPWERMRAIGDQIERAGLATRPFGAGPASIFPRREDDEIAPRDRRMAPIDRARLDAVVAKDARDLASAVWHLERDGRKSEQFATFLADLARLLAHPGTLVAAIAPLAPPEDDEDAPAAEGTPPSWLPAEWNASSAAALADALERGATTFPRVRAAVLRSGEAALDAIGGEMLHVATHPFASSAFADLLAHSARPRDVIRLVTYFAIAPDPAPAARALASCGAPEIARVLGAWLEAMLPQSAEPAAEDDEAKNVPGFEVSGSAARVTACIASLKPYPHLYRAVRPLLTRLSDAPPPSA